MSPALVIAFLAVLSYPAAAQDDEKLLVGEEEAVALALKQNPEVRIADLEVQAERSLRKSSLRLPSMNAGLQYGQINSAATDPFLEISQGLGSIPAHFQRSRLARHQIRVAEEKQELTARDLIFSVRNAWQEFLYLGQVVRELERQLSFYEDFESRANLQYRLGESSLLEKTMIENKLYELRNELTLQSENRKQAHAQLQFLLATERNILAREDTLMKLVLQDAVQQEHPAISILQEETEVRRAEAGVEKALLFPELRIGYFRQNITDTDIRFKGLQGWSVEIAIPLWFRPQQASIQRSRIRGLQAQEELNIGLKRLSNARAKALSDTRKYEKMLLYYQEQGLGHAGIIQRTATLQMNAGEIDFFQYLQSLERYTQTRLDYFEMLRNYNLSVIQLEYLGE